MIIQNYTSIEVSNVPNIWAIDIFECKKHMEPVKPYFIFAYNSYHNNKLHYVEHILTDIKPEKIIEGVTGGISDDFKEVGFWHINYKA
jgi:hypothetical protein